MSVSCLSWDPTIKTNFKGAGNITTGVANGMNTLKPGSVVVIFGHALGRAAVLQAKHSAMPPRDHALLALASKLMIALHRWSASKSCSIF